MALPPEQRRQIPLDAVRAALERAGQAGSEPPIEGTWPGLPVSDPVPAGPRDAGSAAAVLVALFEEAGQARVLLTRRSEQLRTHRGQVSFPGGRLDEGEGAVDAALREAYEEIGLEPASVEVMGWLHSLYTVNAALVLPVVGVLEQRPRPVPNPAEVARVFDVELAELTADGVYREDTWDPYARWPQSGSGARPLWFFAVEGERVWGATARILHELALVVFGLTDGT